LTAKKVVPDTSVLIDGRISAMVGQGELKGANVVVAEASVAELEHLANSGRGIGWKGLRELSRLRELAGAGEIGLEFFGSRPTDVEVAAAPGGAIDNLIRSAALEVGAELVTSDRVQSEVARARGVPVNYIRPEVGEQVQFEGLKIHRFFDDQTFSAHLKEGTAPHAKRGTIGKIRYGPTEDRATSREELLGMASEILDFASRDSESFIEIDRRDSRVVQLRNYRIAIAYPPFSDGVEITAVRPVKKLRLDEYGLERELVARLEDYHRGVLISGRPGDGKSTFAQAVADYLSRKGAVVKTMEQPRDMSLGREITQYGPLEGDMALTSEILLLVRPDFVVYDEVRKTKDFEVFGDMRLAGVGLIGVTHANRAIDAVQRLIGRVELGIIPQVVDTVIHIVDGAVAQVLELDFTVKVPEGMFQEDLSRPVISITDFRSGRELFEIYTYGDQVVVMPVGQGGGRAGGGHRPGGRGGPAPQKVAGVISAAGAGGRVEVIEEPRGGFTVRLDAEDIPRIIGRGGETIRSIERELGTRLRVSPRDGGGGRPETRPAVRFQGKSVRLLVDPRWAGKEVEVLLGGRPLFEATVGAKGVLRVSRKSPLGVELEAALKRGEAVSARQL